MTRAYKNHKATIVYNGEIYNTDYLRKMLSSFNISFETTGDTEIILYCYLVFGTDIFKELNGIFSFVIYDNDTAIVVRDHIGVKPLFYYHNNRECVFSSEPKGIFAYGIKPMINSDSWCEIIRLGPAHTLGNGVLKLLRKLSRDIIKQKQLTTIIMLKLKIYVIGNLKQSHILTTIILL